VAEATERQEAGSQPYRVRGASDALQACEKPNHGERQGQVELDMRGDIGQGGNRLVATPIESGGLGRA
jgi:hypothetical protein